MSVTVTTNGPTIIAEFRRIGYTTTRRLPTLVLEAAGDVRDEWRANAEETSGAHGVHYPGRIAVHPDGPFAANIYPSGSPQGDMSFEFGSRNQPPHLDGQRAIDVLTPRIRRRFESALIF